MYNSITGRDDQTTGIPKVQKMSILSVNVNIVWLKWGQINDNLS